MSFAALESRLNSVVMAKMANATASFNGITVSGIFTDRAADAFGVAGSKPTFTCRFADVCTIPSLRGQALQITGPAGLKLADWYTVADAQPDGAGNLVIDLETP